jgi:hypothetical protein
METAKKVYNYKNAHEPLTYKKPNYTYDDIWACTRKLKPLSKVLASTFRKGK